MKSLIYLLQIPAEIFPTRYRATCHGIAAAAGKLGSIVVQAFLPSINITDPDSSNLGWVLIGFSFAMALGSFFSWAWIPEVQDPRGSDIDAAPGRARKGSLCTGPKSFEVPNKSLEDLAVGRRGVVEEKSILGIRLGGKSGKVAGKQRASKS